MIVRSLDATHDWTFGKGLNDYRSATAAVIQDLNTRLNSWLGDCFFDQGAGVNWQSFLGGKSQLQLNLAVSAVILNTNGVQTMNQLSINVDENRRCTIVYSVTTTFGPASGTTTISI